MYAKFKNRQNLFIGLEVWVLVTLGGMNDPQEVW